MLFQLSGVDLSKLESATSGAVVHGIIMVKTIRINNLLYVNKRYQSINKVHNQSIIMKSS